ncbi:MAG: hypothetical protein ACFFDV_12010 [Candidatus Thorarchaeota archaeon]
MHDKEREIHEKLVEIDKIRKGGNTGIIVGIFMIALIFRVGLIILGIVVIINKMYGKEREIHEKLVEIDNIKKGGHTAYFMGPIEIIVGIFMIALYLAYPTVHYDTYFWGMTLIFGVGFIILGIVAIIDLKWMYPKRMAKAIAEYESIRNME